uniref:Cytochrome b-c1 complex subunit 7 n=1 Tax=Megaselia scalaris TaxID=36166 RepID=T1H7F0_MEGSC
VARKRPMVFSSLGKAYNFSGFNQYVLHRDDCYHEYDYAKEAVRKLPNHLYDERMRITIALHLSMTKTLLPKEQWIKYEEDVKYLEHYLKEVIREHEEEWTKNY